MARIYPTVAESIETHRILIEEFGGSHGLRDWARLEAAIFRPQSGYYGNLIEEAAALMESLIANHAFIDGNKRIGFVMTDVMLRVNGYVLEVEPLTAHQFIIDAIAEGKFRFDFIRDWLIANTRAL